MEQTKILAIAQGAGGLAISAVRAIWPLAALNRRPDYSCLWVKPEDLFNELVAGHADKFSTYDVYVQVRANATIAPGEDPWEALLPDDAVQVYDLDDDLTGQFRDFGRQDGLRDTVGICDAITCTGENLASQMGQYGKPTYVVPNALDVAWYEKSCSRTERDDEVLTIGLIGTTTHFFDWLLVKDALVEIKAEFPHVRVLCGGYRPAYLEDVADEFYASVPFMVYPSLLRQIDIRLCPLEGKEQEPFNLSKSPIAALEAMAAARIVREGHLGGVIPLCSDHPVFQGTIQEGINGMLVKDDGWYDALRKVLKSGRRRTALATTALRWVRAHGSVDQTVDRWAEVYQTILEGKRRGQEEVVAKS